MNEEDIILNMKNGKVSIKNAILYIALTLFLAYKIIFENSMYNAIIPGSFYNLCRLITYLLFVLHFFLNVTVDKKKFIMLFILLIVSFVIFTITKDITILEVVIVLIGCYNSNFKSIIKIAAIELFIFTLVVTLSCASGIIPDKILYHGNLVRHSLGFVYPSKISVIVFELTFLYLFLSKKKVSIIKLAILLLFNIFIYRLTLVRNGIYLAIILFLLYFLCKIFKNIFSNKIIKNTIIFLFPFLFLITFGMNYFYSPNNTFLSKINDVSTGRLSLVKRQIDLYGVKPFGNFIIDYGSDVNYTEKSYLYNYIDSYYMKMLVRYGLVISIIISYLYLKFTKKALENNDKLLIIWLIIIAFEAIFGDMLLNIPFNLVIIGFINYEGTNKENII